MCSSIDSCAKEDKIGFKEKLEDALQKHPNVLDNLSRKEMIILSVENHEVIVSANGVIPPISKLNPEQAMLRFLMGYTSKLAGTETGIVEPVTTFSRFFGEPFMPRNPDVYASIFITFLAILLLLLEVFCHFQILRR